MINFRLIASVFFCSIYAALVLGGLFYYRGSSALYLLFSMSFLLMLITSFRLRTCYGYLFLVIMLWMGFWVKITAHLIFDYAYIEPVGRFVDDSTAWDEVLWIAFFTSAGVMLSRLGFDILTGRYYRANHILPRVPIWYCNVRAWLWLVVIFVLILMAILNSVLGIQQVGLVHRTLLPWPLNALIAWQITIGGSLVLTVLLWWEVGVTKNISWSIFALLAEAVLSTLSVFSRGVYIFHTVPQMIALYNNRKLLAGVGVAKIIATFIVWLCLLLFAIAGVTSLRAYFYPASNHKTTENQLRLTRLEVVEGGISNVKKLIDKGEPQEAHLQELLSERAALIAGTHARIIRNEKQIFAGQTDVIDRESMADVTNSNDSRVFSLENKQAFNQFFYQFRSGLIDKVVSLSVDRWIGLEGVMAVVSYPNKSIELFKEVAFEKRELGGVTKYQNIANSHYQWTDTDAWQFASLPGMAAFLFISGSKWVVLIGAFSFVFILQMAEMAVSKLTANPLLCSLLGITMANTIAQFGVTPRQDIPFYVMNACFILFVYIVQTRMFGQFINGVLHIRKN
jgi:hypothetical protein